MTGKYKILILTPRGKEAGDNHIVRLEIGHQSFDVGRDDFSATEALWMQKQLTLALDRMLAAAPAASGGEDKGDPVCREDDGCPTEGAVLKRFWRAVNTDDTKQLMAFYGVADVPALIEQQVQHVQSLQIKLKAHEPKRDQFPKSPREG